MKKYNLEQINSNTKKIDAIDESWESWCLLGGYRILKKTTGDEFRKFGDTNIQTGIKENFIWETELEQHMYIYMIENLKKESINIVELGAGQSVPSLILAGLIDNTNISQVVKKYKILAVEAEPSHYAWSVEHFLRQNIKTAKVVQCAVSNFDGEVGFHIGKPSNWYGQSIGGEYRVECHKLDTLLKENKMDYIDILHMDIQGEEFKVLKDSEKLLNDINFLYIGTHANDIHQNIINLFNRSKTHDILINFFPTTLNDFEEFGQVKVADGVIFCQHKG